MPLLNRFGGGCNPVRSSALTVAFIASASQIQKQHVFALLKSRNPQQLDDSIFLFSSYEKEAVPIVRSLPYVAFAENPPITCAEQR